MRLAIVGSRTLHDNVDAAAAIAAVIKKHTPTVVVSGGAVGIDTMAKESALAAGIVVFEILPGVRQWDGPGGYKERNARIVDNCDRLICIYDPDSETRGSGWTADLAEKRGIPVERIGIQARESS